MGEARRVIGRGSPSPVPWGRAGRCRVSGAGLRVVPASLAAALSVVKVAAAVQLPLATVRYMPLSFMYVLVTPHAGDGLCRGGTYGGRRACA